MRGAIDQHAIALFVRQSVETAVVARAAQSFDHWQRKRIASLLLKQEEAAGNLDHAGLGNITKRSVNTLVPGWVMTERQLTHWLDAAGERQIDESQVLAGRVMPDDIARMALFLAAEDSAMISAQQFIVDGGWANS